MLRVTEFVNFARRLRLRLRLRLDSAKTVKRRPWLLSGHDPERPKQSMQTDK
jgi:hypothetical protein